MKLIRVQHRRSDHPWLSSVHLALQRHFQTDVDAFLMKMKKKASRVAVSALRDLAFGHFLGAADHTLPSFAHRYNSAQLREYQVHLSKSKNSMEFAC